MIIREVTPHDLDGLFHLATKLNTVNLQPNKEMLAEQIELSQKSFRGEMPVDQAEYLFVLDLHGKIAGSSLIIAQHGTFDRPAVYFKVREDQKYSTSLSSHFKHRVLDLTFEYSGPTEIGGLIVDPEYRGKSTGDGLGKFLSFVRFQYIAMNRDRFRDAIVAEVLPQLREGGHSDLWEALGQKFCGIDYLDADRRSRHDIEFIRSLFPMFPIYTTLLPQTVQDQIGVVGKKSKPAQILLERLGFSWDNSIDPFDGGPTLRVQTDRCIAIRRTVAMDFSGVINLDIGSPMDDDGRKYIALVAKIGGKTFMASAGAYQRVFHGINLEQDLVDRLELTPGDKIAWLPLSGINLMSL